MARFADLSNELIIAIGSHICKPAHSLDLVVLNRQTHSLIIPLLYEHIVLHPIDYAGQEICGEDWKSERGIVTRLANKLRTNPDFRSAIRTFELGLTAAFRPSSELYRLFFLMTSLKQFRLVGGTFLGPTGVVLPPLAYRSATLESLDLSSVHRGHGYPGYGIDYGLDDFIALKHLCIQNRCCKGTMRGLLPKCLQQLEVHCHRYPRSQPLIEQGDRATHVLVDLMEEGLTTPRSLRRVKLCLFWKGRAEPSAEAIQQMVAEFDSSTAKFHQKGIEMDAKVRLVRLDLQALLSR